MIANFEESAECKGHWIRASVRPDGRSRHQQPERLQQDVTRRDSAARILTGNVRHTEHVRESKREKEA